MRVVIDGERIQFSREVDCVPEEYVIEILAADRANQPLSERMRNPRVRNRFDFFNRAYAQIG